MKEYISYSEEVRYGLENNLPIVALEASDDLPRNAVSSKHWPMKVS